MRRTLGGSFEKSRDKLSRGNIYFSGPLEFDRPKSTSAQEFKTLTSSCTHLIMSKRSHETMVEAVPGPSEQPLLKEPQVR
jgi:hypothetical protein